MSESEQWHHLAIRALDLAEQVRPCLDAPMAALTPAIWSGPAAERTAGAAHEQRIAVWSAAAALEHQAEIAYGRATVADGP